MPIRTPLVVLVFIFGCGNAPPEQNQPPVAGNSCQANLLAYCEGDKTLICDCSQGCVWTDASEGADFWKGRTGCEMECNDTGHDYFVCAD